MNVMDVTVLQMSQMSFSRSHGRHALSLAASLPPGRFGVRFPCMSDAYDRELQQLAMDVGQELGYTDFLKEGVYCVLGGPSFETIAECRMLHRLGADAVGESQQEYCFCTHVTGRHHVFMK